MLKKSCLKNGKTEILINKNHKQNKINEIELMGLRAYKINILFCCSYRVLTLDYLRGNV